MSKAPYGRTWWDAQRLQTLAEIDHDNRLPRGRPYANRGAVRDLAVQDNRIQARGQGSRPRPYDIDIEVPPIAATDATRLTRRLAADPGLIARLLNRELDPAVSKQAAALGIKVFPSRWSDLKMHCSGPDWAVPCKHLAAVIYLLSQEIDGDPFLVFRLRGVDLSALLGEHGLVVDAETEHALPAGAPALFDEAERPDSAARDQVDPEALARIDFTTIPDLRESLGGCCPPNPSSFTATSGRPHARRWRASRAKPGANSMRPRLPMNKTRCPQATRGSASTTTARWPWREPAWRARGLDEQQALNAGMQARVVLSAIIDALLRERADKADGAADNKVLGLFFGSGRACFDGPGEGAIAGSIPAWLSRLHLLRLAHRPVLHIDEAQAGGGFALSLAVVDERAALDAPTPLADVIAKPAWARHRLAGLKTVAMLAEFHPPLIDYVRNGARQPLAVRSDELPPLLFETLPALRLMGVRTLLPRALERLLRPRLSMQIKATAGGMPSVLDADAIFSFDWKVRSATTGSARPSSSACSARPAASCASAASTFISIRRRWMPCAHAWRGRPSSAARSCCARPWR